MIRRVGPDPESALSGEEEMAKRCAIPAQVGAQFPWLDLRKRLVSSVLNPGTKLAVLNVMTEFVS